MPGGRAIGRISYVYFPSDKETGFFEIEFQPGSTEQRSHRIGVVLNQTANVPDPTKE
jgi:hypothetical protein